MAAAHPQLYLQVNTLEMDIMDRTVKIVVIIWGQSRFESHLCFLRDEIKDGRKSFGPIFSLAHDKSLGITDSDLQWTPL